MAGEFDGLRARSAVHGRDTDLHLLKLSVRASAHGACTVAAPQIATVCHSRGLAMAPIS